tara:strand:+ start:31933 stop:32229 length:297 start_codon:yes stop_codon:yes gene_type:complete
VKATSTEKENKKRALARDRQRRKRARDKAHNQALGIKTFKIDMFSGTQEALRNIQEFGVLEEWQEAITLMIHNAAELIERDPSQLRDLLNSNATRKAD